MNRQWTRRNSKFSIKKDQHLQSQKKTGTSNAINGHNLAPSSNYIASHGHNLNQKDVKIAEIKAPYDSKRIHPHYNKEKSIKLSGTNDKEEIPEEFSQASKVVSQSPKAEGKGAPPFQPPTFPFISLPLKVYQNDLDRVVTSPLHMRAKVNKTWLSTFQPTKFSKPQQTQVPPFTRTQFQPCKLVTKLASLSASLASSKSKIHWDNELGDNY